MAGDQPNQHNSSAAYIQQGRCPKGDGLTEVPSYRRATSTALMLDLIARGLTFAYAPGTQIGMGRQMIPHYASEDLVRRDQCRAIEPPRSDALCPIGLYIDRTHRSIKTARFLAHLRAPFNLLARFG
jgi:DNA-binding transcriptional LysR family regulator